MTASSTTKSTHRAEVGDDLQAALEAAAHVVGADRVVEPVGGQRGAAPLTLGPNVSGYRSRRIAGIIRPRTAEEVRRVVEIFGRSPTTGALHPFSTGRNWGLGSREPALDDSVALDLGDLDRVRKIDVTGGWAVIEPGVTQGRLADLLAGTERMVNVTVSSAHTSVIGNALDRGVGLRHQRVEDLIGLEVVLPDGQVLHVGWWPDSHVTTAVYPHGLGPSLLPLFVQSDLGVVTAAVIRLLPRPEALRVVRLSFRPESLGPAVDELRRWVSQSLVRGVLKVYNPAAARGYGETDEEFLAHVCLDGTAAAVDALTTIVTGEATRSGLFTQVSATDAIDAGRQNHEVAKLVERAYAGDPDGHDTIFRMKLGYPADQLDERGGFLFFLPLVPFRGASIELADKLLDQVHSATGIRCGATLNALNADVIDLVVSIKFARGGEQAEAAHRALDLLYRKFAEVGFMPYRLDVDHSEWMERFSRDAPSRQLVRRLKTVLDPNNAIAPGRYR